MTLFTDIEPDRQPKRRGWVGWSILGVALVGIVVVALVPAPYVIEVPGPVFDTLGTVEVGGEEVELIEIDGEQTYETAGALDMLTVRIEFSRDNLPTWLEVGQAYLDPSKAVLPVDDVFPLGYSVEDSNVQGQIDMQNSQQEAIAAALDELGYTFESRLKVAQTQEGGPADGVLEAGDIILSLNGVQYADVTGLRGGIAENGTETPASVLIERDGQERTVEITPVLSEGDAPAPIVGIIVGGEYEFPVDVTIQLENVGGPSAGMMFALGIIDKLTPGELNGGEFVAGTGTIAGDGTVGAIGGIRQKMYGAKDAGATWFLAPTANCNEVSGHIPGGLSVFSVDTLDDALAVLEVIAEGGDTSALATCPAG
ncbi:MAG: PDZ domain-containing protein [Actinomycetota bacterium]|nr:PDZ domain-containing protein [Actinomycetota bacterium]